MSEKFYRKKRLLNKSKLIFMVTDAFGITLTYFLAIFALWTMVPEFDYVQPLIILPFIVVFKIAIYYLFKLYHFVLENVGLDEVVKISLVVTMTNIIIIVATLIIPDFEFINEMYFVFTTLLELLFAVVPRILRRLILILAPKSMYNLGNRTLIIGAGSGGKIALNEIRNNPNFNNNIIGYVDDDEDKIGNLMSGYPIFGPVSETGKLIDRMNIEEVIIAVVNIEPKKFQEIVHYFIDKPVKIKRLPSFKDFRDDSHEQIADVNVEDLLSRDVIELDTKGISEFISGRRILITGAGGSIGSELVRQIIKYRPTSILMVDIYENNLYDLSMELDIEFSTGRLRPLEIKMQIASVYNYHRMKDIVSDYLPNYIFHAAAYKHVPLMEGSATEAIRTNILGTYNMCKLADEFKVEKFVLVSSDKAVRPTNVMGATKRYAEMLIQHFDKLSKTNYSAVRFGNVLGSNGSVVPLFKKQIANGGPVTVTDKNIIRYFMTIPEAVGLILQSAVFAAGGEIFILDMGEPVKIIDLAKKMIMLSGFKPYTDIQIKITGLRPGEKLFEELLVDKENNIKTKNKLIYIEKLENGKDIEDETQQLLNSYEDLKNKEVKHLLKKYVSTYTVDEKH
ncbi:MAG: nucleoside-diphosphate sugar epimerase/dehydratase [Candidatus Izemoplasmatales bacterium]